MEEEKDLQDVQETPEGDSKPEDESDAGALTPEELEELRKKAEASSKNFERLKKAEEELKQLREKQGQPQEGKKEEGLSQKDVIYLAKADIHEDDMDEVLEWAKFKGISLKEAHEYMKPQLQVKDEQRRTAEATHTGKQPGGASKVSDEAVLNKARKGQISDDDKEIDRLVEAQLGQDPRFAKK